MIKIHILFRFSEGAWGGGNQFLKALRKYFQEKKAYTENPRKADVVLFNSNKGSLLTLVKKLCQLKFKYKKVLINRIDGPIHLRNVGAHFFDELIIRINSLLMDGCVFQSNWAFKKMKEIGEGQNCMSKIIHNAPDKNIFYPSSLKQRNNQKIKIIATSWSHNYYAKGFDIYDFLEDLFIYQSDLSYDNILIELWVEACKKFVDMREKKYILQSLEKLNHHLKLPKTNSQIFHYFYTSSHKQDYNNNYI